MNNTEMVPLHDIEPERISKGNCAKKVPFIVGGIGRDQDPLFHQKIHTDNVANKGAFFLYVAFLTLNIKT